MRREIRDVVNDIDGLEFWAGYHTTKPWVDSPRSYSIVRLLNGSFSLKRRDSANKLVIDGRTVTGFYRTSHRDKYITEWTEPILLGTFTGRGWKQRMRDAIGAFIQTS